jgi:radical SAM superfamily enzyme YgiQ (UPF0313 family)
MKVLLISANTETLAMPTLPLGLASVAAATRQAGHDVSWLNLMFEGEPKSAVQAAIEDFRPNLIGISVRNIDDQNMLQPRFLLASVRQVVAACRTFSDAPLVLGGAGYSIFPQAALRYLGADMGVQGEGEAVFPLLLDRISKGEQVSDLPGLHLPGRFVSSRSSSFPRKRESTADVDPSLRGGDTRSLTEWTSDAVTNQERPPRHFEKNLDVLPQPEPRSWIPSRADHPNLWVPVQTRRGCPLGCSYCSTAMIEGESVRSRSPAPVVGWLGELRKAGCRNANFVDNTFNLPLDYAKDLCRQIIAAQLDLDLWCIIYPKWIDAELVELMSRAGCRQVSLGFESGSDRMLANLNKQFDVEDIRSASRMFAEAGIERMGFLLLGGPGETRESVEESLAFADSLHLEALKITTGLRIYPGTPLAGTALAEGIIAPHDDLLFPRFYVPPHLKDWLLERIAAYRATRPWVN